MKTTIMRIQFTYKNGKNARKEANKGKTPAWSRRFPFNEGIIYDVKGVFNKNLERGSNGDERIKKRE
ncbi:MAG: hypothetical protein L6276_00065 [Acetobacterium sp.]|nr:hypothetical protein [Bacillota bacterium]MCG2728678.1 hypothetical protein [Acetobacterium sp.]